MNRWFRLIITIILVCNTFFTVIGCSSERQVTLYFADSQIMYLKPEKRTVEVRNSIEETIINELIKGPQKPELRRTIPEGTKLLSVSVKDSIAYVNFSTEFKTKHWGGSAGESMTIYSVINSLAKLNKIEKVQSLIEGNIHESLAGHIGINEPLEPDWNMVKDRKA